MLENEKLRSILGILSNATGFNRDITGATEEDREKYAEMERQQDRDARKLQLSSDSSTNPSRK